MRQALAFCTAATVLLFSQSVTATELGAGLKFGTLGFGLEGHAGLSRMFSATLGGNFFNFDTTIEEESDDGVSEPEEADLELDFRSVALLLNFHPARGWFQGFRISTGLMLNGNEGNITYRVTDSFEVNDKEYSPAQVGMLKGKVDFRSVAPYLGIGWGQVGGRRWGFSWDLGVMFQGSPGVSLEATGPIAGNPTFQADLEAEIQDVEEELEPLQFYPVVSVGFHYRF